MKTFHRLFFYLGTSATIVCVYFRITNPNAFSSQSTFTFSLLDIALVFLTFFIFFYTYAFIRCIVNLVLKKPKPTLPWLLLVLIPLFGPYLYFEFRVFPSSSKMEIPEDDLLPDIEVPTRVTIRRALASISDYGLFISFAFAYIRFFGHETVPGTYELSGARSLILFPAVWLIWFPIAESIWGQTLGKAIFGVKVFTKRGAKVPFALTLKRHLLDIPDVMFGAALASMTTRKGPPRRLGDMWAGTIVASKHQEFRAINSAISQARTSGAT